MKQTMQLKRAMTGISQNPSALRQQYAELLRLREEIKLLEHSKPGRDEPRNSRLLRARLDS
jgi:hypothetical protein